MSDEPVEPVGASYGKPAKTVRPVPFIASNERERRSQEVLKAACKSGRAADLLEALASGGTYGYNHITGELVLRPRTYRSEPPYDAVRLTMTNNTAKVVALAVIDPEGSSQDARDTARAIAEKVFLLAGRESVTEPVAHTLDGVEWDEVNETLEGGVVAQVALDHMLDAQQHKARLGLLYGAPPAP